MTDVVIVDPNDVPWLTFDWSVFLPASVTIGTVTHTVPSPLTKVQESTDTGAGTSRVKVSGFVHGAIYMIEGRTPLSNGETFERQFPVRAFNG